MSERKAFLNKISIKNFLSLRDVTLPFKPLTVLVGPNASGKSNTFSALYHFHQMTFGERLPSYTFTKDSLWAGEAQKITFHLWTEVEKNQALYCLEVKSKPDFSYHIEQLLVNNVEVISIQDGQGVVRDENGENETTYNSDRLAFRSSGFYGDKPVTRNLAEFIKEWEIYNFDTDYIRRRLRFSSLDEKEIRKSPKLGGDGSWFTDVLWNWHHNSPDRFRNVSDALAASTDIGIAQRLFEGQYQFCLLEGYKEPIPLHNASDGILRLIAYYILLNEPELPPLIAIEEPERNLHPGALKDVAYVLEQIAKYSQVIITTHSSQLLGAFNPESLGDSLGVLLLRNRPGFGTEVLNLEDYRGKKKALDGWIADFGIGSAVFDSGLLPDEMEGTAECQA